MDRGAWWAVVHGVGKEQDTDEGLSMHACTYHYRNHIKPRDQFSGEIDTFTMLSLAVHEHSMPPHLFVFFDMRRIFLNFVVYACLQVYIEGF